MTGKRRENKVNGNCRVCGIHMQSRNGGFVCMPCLMARRKAEGKAIPENWLEAYCEYCGRRHINRFVCLERYERAAKGVRLWLAGMTEDDDRE